MGDTGSLAIGSLFVSIMIILKMEIFIFVFGFIYVLETLSVILQVMYFKLTKGKRLFKMAPLHHHLELSGMKETKIVSVFWLITAVLCIIAYFV